tara:strand:- start:4821 stop:5042 length:222 start_codon:yes stop_codon:yes gene_type:complete
MKAEFLEARKVWDNMIDQQSAKVEILWEDQPVGSDKHYVCYVLKSKWMAQNNVTGNGRYIVELNDNGSWEIFT